jgi:hypothetical protein
MGSVTHPNPNVYRWTVTAKPHVYALIHLFNGRLILEKRQTQFAFFLNIWNQLNPNQIVLLSDALHYTEDLKAKHADLKSAWFSGRIDAEGCFNVCIQKNKAYATGYRVRLRFLLDQKDAPELWPMVQNAFGLGCLSVRQPSGVVRYSLTHRGHMDSRIQYLETYPRKTQKRIYWARWSLIFRRMTEKKHLTMEGRFRVMRLKKRSAGGLD